MSDLLHRIVNSTLPVAVGSRGIEMIDGEGRSYIDASGGAAVTSVGHGHPDILAALHRQLDQLAFAHSGFFTTEVAEQLAARLVEDAPEGLRKVMLLSSGSEAVEAALKMARQYYLERGEPQRRFVISRRQSYHGATLGTLGVGRDDWRRELFSPFLVAPHQIDPCYAYRFQRDGETEAQYAARAAQQLEDLLIELGPDRVMAFIAETVVGTPLGAVTPAAGYFKRIREICDRHGVLLIADEVMCGMGRTGTLHACEQEGFAPDLMPIAKGLGGGYQPIGAVLLSGKIFDAFAAGSGAFQHNQTYLAHPMPAAAALAVLETIRRDNLLGNVVAMGEKMRDALIDRLGDHPQVGNLRGRGLFRGIELVRDRATKEPFEPSFKLSARIKQESMARGLMISTSTGTIDGKRGDHILLAPPYIIDEAGVARIVEGLGDAIDAAIKFSAR